MVELIKKGNGVVCPECGELVRLNRCYMDKCRWLWCHNCGLVLENSVLDYMSLEGFLAWVREHAPGLGYKDVRVLCDAWKDNGKEEAFKMVPILIRECNRW